MLRNSTVVLVVAVVGLPVYMHCWSYSGIIPSSNGAFLKLAAEMLTTLSFDELYTIPKLKFEYTMRLMPCDTDCYCPLAIQYVVMVSELGVLFFT